MLYSLGKYDSSCCTSNGTYPEIAKSASNFTCIVSSALLSLLFTSLLALKKIKCFQVETLLLMALLAAKSFVITE